MRSAPARVGVGTLLGVDILGTAYGKIEHLTFLAVGLH